MIYYLCPDTDEPYGGVKKIYAHVDILTRNAMDACVLHGKRGFRCTWFENSTRVEYIKDARITKDDYVVIPEFLNLAYIQPSRRDHTARMFWSAFDSPAKIVVFNQGTYITFSWNTFDVTERKNLHMDPRTVAVITVSEDGQRFLRYAFPSLKTFRVHNAINPDVFTYNPVKKKQICLIANKNTDHALCVINALKFRGVLDGFTVVPISNKTERETARIMKDSLIFLSMGTLEGFSLPPAEAMACGCIVVGYHGMGGREYFLPDFCYPVEACDIHAFVKSTEEVISMYRNMPKVLEQKALKAANYIRRHYSPLREQDDVLSCWRSILTP